MGMRTLHWLSVIALVLGALPASPSVPSMQLRVVMATTPAYGLPKGATSSSDQTAADGTRTIRYRDANGNDVTIRIDSKGKATETVKQPNGRETSREFDVTFHADGSRTEASTEGSEHVERSFYQNGTRKEVTRTTEQPTRGDSTTVDRTTRTKKYDENGNLVEEIEIDETAGLAEGWQNIPKRRRVKHTRYEGGVKVEETVEQLRLETLEDGVPTMSGRRSTRTFKDGKEESRNREVWDNNSNSWVPYQPSPGQGGTDDTGEGEPHDTHPGGVLDAALENPYVYVSPGFIHIPIDSEDGVGFQWGLGGGVLLRPDPKLVVAVGGSFEHSLLNPPDFADEFDIDSSQYRLQAEAMPGTLLLEDRLFVHGTIALGYVGWFTSFDAPGGSSSNSQHGIVLSLGGGAMLDVWRNLSVGLELGVDLQRVWFDGVGQGASNLDMKAVGRWRF
jgi:hypothetical protein